MEENVSKKPMREVLREMAVGDVKDFPLEKHRTIRSYCTELKMSYQKTFRTKTINSERKFSVQRIN